MAIAVIGGLISSTVLSLVFVPAVFVLMDDIANASWRLVGRFVGPTDEPDTASKSARAGGSAHSGAGSATAQPAE